MLTFEWEYCRWSGWTVYFRVRARKQRNRLCNSFAGLHVKSESISGDRCRSESSHMPLHPSFSYNPDYCNTKCKKSKKEHRTLFRWDPDKADLFSEAVSSNIFKEKLTEAFNLLNESVESATKLFTDNLLQAAKEKILVWQQQGPCYKSMVWSWMQG